MANKPHKNEEPVGWVTIKGKHFPKWKDGTIGWQDGQEEIPNKNSDIRESGGKYFAAYSGSEKARRQGIKDTERAFDTQEEAEEFLRKKNSPSKIKPLADKSSNEKRLEFLMNEGMDKTNAQKYLSYQEKVSRLEHELNAQMDNHSTNWVRQRKEEIDSLKGKMQDLRYAKTTTKNSISEQDKRWLREEAENHTDYIKGMDEKQKQAAMKEQVAWMKKQGISDNEISYFKNLCGDYSKTKKSNSGKKKMENDVVKMDKATLKKKLMDAFVPIPALEYMSEEEMRKLLLHIYKNN